MCPKNIHRLELETIGSCSKTVIGILLITMVIPFGLSIMGVWEYGNTNGGLSDVSETPFIPDNNPLGNLLSEDQSSESSSSEGDILEEPSSEVTIANLADTNSEEIISGTSDASVLYSGLFGPFDVEAGTIEIIHENLPGPDYEFPLCITQADVDEFYMVVAVKGGYEPVGGAILVFQAKNCYQGSMEIVWTEVACHDDSLYSDCCWTFWEATLLITDPICLESNQAPTVGSDFNVYPSDIDLQKDVWICVKTMWTGCPLPDQHFIVILAHKVMSQKEFPTPDKSTSPV